MLNLQRETGTNQAKKGGGTLLGRTGIGPTIWE